MTVLVAACMASTAVIVLMIHDRHDLWHSSTTWVSLLSAPSYKRALSPQHFHESPEVEQALSTATVRILSFLATILFRTVSSRLVLDLDPRLRGQSSSTVGESIKVARISAPGIHCAFGPRYEISWQSKPGSLVCLKPLTLHDAEPWHWCGRRSPSRVTEPCVAQPRQTSNQYSF